MSEKPCFASRLKPMALAAGLGLGLGLGVSGPAVALTWQIGDVGVDLNTRVSSGVEMRVQNADRMYIGIANGGKAYSNNVDDGELAFHNAGDIVYATQKITPELTVSYKNFGIFSRANYTWDPVLDYKDFFNIDNFGPGKEAGFGADVAAEKERQVHRHAGADGHLLELYAYGSVDVFGHGLTAKIGKQIVNWGESTLVLNGLNSLVSLDANKARLPGAEVSEFTIPVPQIFAGISLSPSVSIEGFYQWHFEPTIPDAAGTFYPIPNQDFTGPAGTAGDISFGRALENAAPGTDCSATGGNNTLTPTTCVPYGGSIPRSAERRPHGSGQFGGALHFSIPWLNNMDVGVYAANYHERLPVYSSISAASGNISAASASYFAEFPKNVHMFGFSFNTTVLGVAFQGEYSYKPNQPMQLSAVESELTTLGAPSQISPIAGQALGHQDIRGWRRKEISQVDLSVTDILGHSNWFHYDQMILLAEVAGDRVHNLESPSTLAYEGPATWQPNTAAESFLFNVPQQHGGYPTANSWGYKLLARSSYYNAIFDDVTLEPTLLFQHDVAGITPQPLGNFVKNSRAFTPSLGWRYRDNLTGEVGYTNFFGGGQSNLLRDRDFVSAYVRYTF